MNDAVVLSYGDSLLRSRDVVLLQSPNWLNDALIGFAFEFLADELDDLRNEVAMISPEVTQFVKLASTSVLTEECPLDLFLEPLNLPLKQFVFLAVNNQELADRVGGTHWSLLLFSRSDHQFLHFDSSAPSNSRAASKIAFNLFPFLSAPGPFPGVVDGVGGRQSNGFDCGVFLIWHAESLVDNIKRRCPVTDPLRNVRQSEIETKRQEWRARIESLKSSS